MLALKNSNPMFLFSQYFEQFKKKTNFCLVSFEVLNLKGSNFVHFFEGWKKMKNIKYFTEQNYFKTHLLWNDNDMISQQDYTKHNVNISVNTNLWPTMALFITSIGSNSKKVCKSIATWKLYFLLSRWNPGILSWLE